jgi:hypothetical protein
VRRIPFERAFEKYKEMNWVDDKVTTSLGKKRLSRNWDQWNLSAINIVRADSNMDYQETTKALFDSLNMKIRSINSENVDFLEQLFLLVMENTKKGKKSAKRQKIAVHSI